MKVECSTLFDITITGTTGHFRAVRLPFVDRTDRRIHNQAVWNVSRNQQRNWETITQLINMRTQMIDASVPRESLGKWTFDFEYEATDVYRNGSDELGLLKIDCNDVPMILGLNETGTLDPVLRTTGARSNIWFVPKPDK